MPKKCGVVNCKGNYNDANKCRVFRLPHEESERQKWLNTIPPREDFVIDPSKYVICEKHWPQDAPMKKVPGGVTRPTCPPSIFDVPRSCLPSHKPTPRPAKIEDRQLDYFNKKDRIYSLTDFSPDKELKKKYGNIILLSKTEKEFVCVFMTPDFKESYLSIIVHNQKTMCAPLTVSAFKNGINVPLAKELGPNNGLSTYSQYFEAVNHALNFDPTVDKIIDKVVICIQSTDLESIDADKARKLNFITRQLELLSHKKFSTADYCFALGSFPRCSYDQLRDCLVLPCPSKLHSIISNTDLDTLLQATFRKVNEKQKNVFLIIDEVKIRPSVSFSGGVLSGMAKNDENSKATSMLCVMMKCLHGGPSLMVSVTPVNKLTVVYQFNVVKDVAAAVEKAGGIVIGSITDNHKLNQHYCKQFQLISNCTAVHPFDQERIWFLLFDTVHILKCIWNNWITEKCKRLSLDGHIVGSFSDVRNLYESEKGSSLKITPLTRSSVYPSRLQLQNVTHVLHVFNDKVVAALRLHGYTETATFIQQVLDWWNIVNVSAKGQEIRLRDPKRAVQVPNSTNLQLCLELFERSKSGHGSGRKECLTHDTLKALLQTTKGLIAVCSHLFSVGFKYVILRSIQSDRIEGEFSVYRQSNGANAFMNAGNVFASFKKRLTRFGASYLMTIEEKPTEDKGHICEGDMNFEDGSSIERCIEDVTLSDMEESAVAYVAGWLESKCHEELEFDEDEPFLTSKAKDFIEEVSRGGLTVPRTCTYELVRIGLCFVMKSKHRACCRRRLISVLSIANVFYDLNFSSKGLFRRLANVLLKGLHNLYKDQDDNTELYQTSIKKARMAE